MGRQRFVLSTEEANQLRLALDEYCGRAIQMRLRSVLAYGSGLDVETVTEGLRCSRTSLMTWCRSYRQSGLPGLLDGRCGGNNARLSSQQVDELIDRLRQTTPHNEFGASAASHDGENWTVKDLYRAIQQWYCVVYCSPSSYYSILARLKKQV